MTPRITVPLLNRRRDDERQSLLRPRIAPQYTLDVPLPDASLASRARQAAVGRRANYLSRWRAKRTRSEPPTLTAERPCCDRGRPAGAREVAERAVASRVRRRAELSPSLDELSPVDRLVAAGPHLGAVGARPRRSSTILRARRLHLSPTPARCSHDRRGDLLEARATTVSSGAKPTAMTSCCRTRRSDAAPGKKRKTSSLLARDFFEAPPRRVTSSRLMARLLAHSTTRQTLLHSRSWSSAPADRLCGGDRGVSALARPIAMRIAEIFDAGGYPRRDYRGSVRRSATRRAPDSHP